MHNVNFNDLVSALKSVENSEVKESIFHKDGVYRETVISINPYTITIEYIDFGRSHIPLKFLAETKTGEKYTFTSIDEFQRTLNLDLKIPNTWIDKDPIMEPLNIYDSEPKRK